MDKKPETSLLSSEENSSEEIYNFNRKKVRIKRDVFRIPHWCGPIKEIASYTWFRRPKVKQVTLKRNFNYVFLLIWLSLLTFTVVYLCFDSMSLWGKLRSMQMKNHS